MCIILLNNCQLVAVGARAASPRLRSAFVPRVGRSTAWSLNLSAPLTAVARVATPARLARLSVANVHRFSASAAQECPQPIPAASNSEDAHLEGLKCTSVTYILGPSAQKGMQIAGGQGKTLGGLCLCPDLYELPFSFTL